MRLHLLSAIPIFLVLTTSLPSPITPRECANAPSVGPLKTIVHFSDGNWAENLHLRNDGSVLITMYEGDIGQVVLVTPRPEGPGDVQVVHRFESGKTGAAGIVETEPDIYYFTTVTRGQYATDLPFGTGQVWKVDLRTFNGAQVPLESVTNLTASILLNGATTTEHNPKKILVADSQVGVIWRIDPTTGAYDIAANDTLLRNITSTGLGVNGIHIKNNFLYFTNTDLNLYGRFPVSDSGLQVGPVETLNGNLTFAGVDDFSVFPGLSTAGLFASDPNNGTFFQSETCTKRLATTNGTTANKIAWNQMKEDGSVPVFVTSEGGFMAYERPGPIRVGGALSMFEMNVGGYCGEKEWRNFGGRPAW